MQDKSQAQVKIVMIQVMLEVFELRTCEFVPETPTPPTPPLHDIFSSRVLHSLRKMSPLSSVLSSDDLS